MVAVAQSVEHWFVEPVVTGSIPVGHPKRSDCILQCLNPTRFK